MPVDDRPAARAVTAGAVSIGADGTCRVGKALAKPTDAPIRDDLPREHPLYGTRALRVVPCGMSDIVIAADGRAVACDEKGEPLKEATPVDEKPGGDAPGEIAAGEIVGRGR